jgi:hypothetical protein
MWPDWRPIQCRLSRPDRVAHPGVNGLSRLSYRDAGDGDVAAAPPPITPAAASPPTVPPTTIPPMIPAFARGDKPGAEGGAAAGAEGGAAGGPSCPAAPSGPVHLCWLEVLRSSTRMHFVAGEIGFVLGSTDPVTPTVQPTNRSRSVVFLQTVPCAAVHPTTSTTTWVVSSCRT